MECKEKVEKLVKAKQMREAFEVAKTSVQITSQMVQEVIAQLRQEQVHLLRASNSISRSISSFLHTSRMLN